MSGIVYIFVPGSQPDRIAKAAGLEVDSVLIDLEDSVPEALKATARGQVAALLSDVPKRTIVRLNNQQGLIDADLEAVVRPGLDAIALPEAGDPAQIVALDQAISTLEAARGMEAGSVAMVLILESALGVHRCYDLITASRRVETVIFGSAENGDLQRDLGCAWSPEGTELLYARSKVVLDARAAGLSHILDGVYSRLDDDEGLRRDCRLSRRLGYTGRTIVHPRQLQITRDAYGLSAEDAAYYRRLVTEFEANMVTGKGAINFEGKLVDWAMFRLARDRLALHAGSGADDAP